MSLGQNETFESTLKKELKEAGLPTDPREVVGRKCQFANEFGSHHQILCGTVEALRVSDVAGLELFVSNPTFNGDPLESIMFGDDCWKAVTKVDQKHNHPQREYFPVKFNLL